MLEAKSIVKRYAGADRPAVNRLDLHVRRGEFLSIVGRSGSGKSTLLHILASLIKPDSGSILFQGLDICSASEDRRNQLRGRDFAVVFQQHYLLPYLSVLENVLLPFLNGFRTVKQPRLAMARDILERMELGRKENSRPGELSGGEQQRVAIARALVRGASILFADEPTGSLDFATGSSIMRLLHELNADGLTIVMVTHNSEFANSSDRVVRMADGEIS
ncbi:MAG: ABC transporter ATP-binding protein [Deltaproteobacteria bacterium]|jgi:putative ABC transport system ATP-binding protein|nr:ABC transporter ATP-binding protein [Deltaproteobacteria bacterium]